MSGDQPPKKEQPDAGSEHGPRYGYTDIAVFSPAPVPHPRVEFFRREVERVERKEGERARVAFRFDVQ